MAGKVVKVSVVAETKKFSRAFKGLVRESGISSLIDHGKKLAVTLAAVTTAAVATGAGIGAALVGLGGRLEQSAGAVQDVFKDAAGEMQAFAKQAPQAVGLAGNAYNELATILGTQLKNAGVPMGELAGKTNELIGLGSDLAAMFGGSTQDAVNALSSALKGERDPIERYGVSLRQTTIDAKAAEMGFEKIGGAFDQEAQAAATLALIMDQTTDAHGKFAREGNTWSHQVEVWKATITDFGERMGMKLLPSLTKVSQEIYQRAQPVLEKLGNWIETTGAPAIERFGNTIATEWIPRISEAAKWVSANIVPALKTMATYLTGTVIPAIINTATWIRDNAAAIAPFAAAILTLVGAWKTWQMAIQAWKVIQMAATAAQLAFNIAANANPIGIIITLVAAVVAGITTWLATNEEARAKLLAVWEAIKTGIGNAVNGVITWVQNLGKIPGQIGAWFTSAKDRALQAWNNLVADAKALPGRVIGGIASLGSQLLNAARNHFNNIVTGARNGVNALWSFVSSIPRRILSSIGNLGSLLWNAGASVIQGFIDGIKSMFGSVASTLGDLTNKLFSWKGPPKRDKVLLKPAGQMVIDGFINGLESRYAAVKSTLGSLTTNLAANALGGIPTGLGPARVTVNNITVEVKALDPTPEVGRKIAEAIEVWLRVNGKDR